MKAASIFALLAAAALPIHAQSTMSNVSTTSSATTTPTEPTSVTSSATFSAISSASTTSTTPAFSSTQMTSSASTTSETTTSSTSPISTTLNTATSSSTSKTTMNSDPTTSNTSVTPSISSTYSSAPSKTSSKASTSMAGRVHSSTSPSFIHQTSSVYITTLPSSTHKTSSTLPTTSNVAAIQQRSSPSNSDPCTALQAAHAKALQQVAQLHQQNIPIPAYLAGYMPANLDANRGLGCNMATRNRKRYPGVDSSCALFEAAFRAELMRVQKVQKEKIANPPFLSGYAVAAHDIERQFRCPATPVEFSAASLIA